MMRNRASFSSVPSIDGGDKPNFSCTAFAEDPESTNKIRTQKYTWYLFVGQNLFEQFQALANVYFLVTAVLQCYKPISVTFGKPTYLLPLSIVLSVSAVKDAWEDLRRSAADREENEKRTRLVMREPLEQNKVETADIAWQDVRVGQLLEVRDGEPVPADLLLVGSLDGGRTASLETKSLDGETNIKKKSCALPSDWCLRDLARNDIHVEYECASANLYEFKGALSTTLHNEPNDEQQVIGVSIANLLLRSSIMRSEKVWGLVLYSGHDTRIMKNASGSRFKMSELDIKMNRLILYIFAFELFLCASGGLYYTLWEEYAAQDYEYMMLGYLRVHPVILFFQTMGTWILQMANLVPISMLVSLSMVKFAQGFFIIMDDEMTDSLCDRAGVNTSQVLESLGQISHVLSDKTGTLTCNEMVYKACSVTGGGIFGMRPSTSYVRTDRSVDFNDVEGFFASLEKALPSVRLTMARFLLCHALCHTVDIARNDKSDKPRFDASSPDELALVSFAREVGLEFCSADSDRTVLRVSDRRLSGVLSEELGVSVEQMNENITITFLNLCPFDNDRKRMSVVVQYPSGKIVMMVKGADTTMMDFAQETDNLHSDLLTFAVNGLRTLAVGGRELTKSEHDGWSSEYLAAQASMSGDRASEISRLSCQLEERFGLKLWGATAIEDRLQDGVCDTLAALRDAGMRLWVLTGDKVETAVNIGKASRLLTQEMQNIRVEGTEQEIQDTLRNDEFFSGKETRELALTIDGEALSYVLSDDDLRKLFYRRCNLCKSVLCCRVSPRQKAQVVKLVHRYHLEVSGEKPVTLAIGDGANDVSMITVACVGVGLAGKEGVQASRAADFSFGRFRFLRRLLLLHGHESYRRNSVLVCYNFYKNSVLVLPPFFFGVFMDFSGQPIYEQVLYQLYNVVFTCLPVILFALFDREEDDLNALPEHPRTYTAGIQRLYLNQRVFLFWMLTGFAHALIICIIAFSTFSDGSVAQGLTSGDVWSTGAVIFLWAIAGVNLTLLFRKNQHFPFSLAVAAGSVLAHPLILFGVELFGGQVGANTIDGTFSMIYGFSNRRYTVALFVFLGFHVLVGESVLRRAYPPPQAKVQTRHPGYTRVAPQPSAPLLSQPPDPEICTSLHELIVPATSSHKLTAFHTPTISSAPFRRVSSFAMSAECAIETHNQQGAAVQFLKDRTGHTSRPLPKAPEWLSWPRDDS